MRSASTGFGHGLRSHWLLDDDVRYLNHGSVGATPLPVLQAQDEWRRRIERDPVRFMGRELQGALRDSANELAAFLGADGEGLAFVDNATSAINAVLACIDWQPGDDIVLCREAYAGVRNAVARHVERRGAIVRVAHFPIPIPGPPAVIDALEAVLGERTRLAVLDHVSSTLAAVLPLARMIERCRARGVPVLVDGAHAPGMIDVAIADLGADWYAGNGHKWLCAPRGTGFLWTAPARRAATHPLVTSVWHGQGYPREFDWAGTRDPSGWLCVPAALAFLRSLGVAAMRAWQRDLAGAARTRLSAVLGTEASAPASMFAAMASVRLPAVCEASLANGAAIHDRLRDDHSIEVPVYPIAGALWVRISAQVYLELDDFQRLERALPAVLQAVGTH